MSAVLRLGALAALALVLAGCEAGPDYQRPPAPVPAAYKETDPGWKLGQPEDAIDRGAWWTIYRDPVLDGLEKEVDISNQTLKAEEAAFRQSEALATAARAGLFPTFTANAQAQRSRGGGSIGSTPGGGGGGGHIGNFFELTADASWTPDLWGSVRRTIEASEATAQASAGTLAGARLSAQGTLASDYLELRVADELQRLLEQAVAAYSQSVQIAHNQARSGIVSQSDVAQAQAQLDQTRAQLIAVGVSRAQFEHAIAVLIGKAPADFSIAPVKDVLAVPQIPPGVPSALLERRPDIAVAERQMAAQNAEIGVAEAAFFPTVNLTADYGGAASKIAALFNPANRLWAFGSTAVQTLFDGGAHQANLAAQRASFDQAVATYRQTVLSSFQQVEDELAALRILAQQAQAAASATAAAREAERIINNQYLAGTQAYTAVIVAEQTALGDAESQLSVRQSQLVASVALIQALGGGWNAAQLPSSDKIESDQPLNFSPIPAPDPHPVK
jgi:NodT family efflux transporter outer membrane factor (OMF) lipoprotein